MYHLQSDKMTDQREAAHIYKGRKSRMILAFIIARYKPLAYTRIFIYTLIVKHHVTCNNYNALCESLRIKMYFESSWGEREKNFFFFFERVEDILLVLCTPTGLFFRAIDKVLFNEGK